MKLIDEKEVEEAAKDYAATRANSEIWRQDIRDDFTLGVSFAESKLQPNMIEFAEWLAINGKPVSNEGKILYWKMRSYQSEEQFTTEQLLEQFLKTR